MKISFTSYPRPRITWFRGEEKIQSGGHYAVEVKVLPSPYNITTVVVIVFWRLYILVLTLKYGDL